MNKLVDDELGLILSRVTDPDDRKSASQVCKKWRTVESLSRSSLRVLSLDHLPRLLARYPNLATFETGRGMTNADLALVAQSCPKLEVIILDEVSTDLEVQVIPTRRVTRDGLRLCTIRELNKIRDKLLVLREIGDEALCALANGCPKLSRIVIRGRTVGMVGLARLITSSVNLTHLDLENMDLERPSKVDDQDLEAIGSSRCRIEIFGKWVLLKHHHDHLWQMPDSATLLRMLETG